MTLEEAYSVLCAARASRIGILLRTNRPEPLRQLLYRARTSSGDPALDGLQIRISPISEGDLVVVNRQILSEEKFRDAS